MKSNSSIEYDVSIILATKNRAQLLDEMLASLKKASEGIHYEVIVIEGNSSDNTIEILQKHGIEQIYDETEYLGKGKHSWPQLYNFGFSQAKGKWAMFASDDIIFSRGCLSEAVSILNHQTQDVAGGIFFYKNINAESGWENFGIDFTHGQKLLMNYGLIRLDCFTEVRGFDENYQFYCADADICLKLYEKGKQFVPLSGCLITHNNIFDNQKKINLEIADQDIQRFFYKWRHFVSSSLPKPRRLIWQESLSDALNLPSNLNHIGISIEYFWHGLAYFQQSDFIRAVDKLTQTIEMSCNHWIVFWYLSQAAYKAGFMEKAIQAAMEVVKAAPQFEAAKTFLSKLKESSSEQSQQNHLAKEIHQSTKISFEQTWKIMQKEYLALNTALSANGYSDFEDVYCHSKWIDAKKQISQLILGEINPKFLFNPVISTMMVRQDFTTAQEYEIAFLEHCISDTTKQLLSQFKDTDFGYLPHNCIEFNCSVNTLGQLFYAARVLERIDKQSVNTIVEFGGGYGNLARIFKMIIPESTFFIFDLPELIALQFLFLKNTLPWAEVLIHSQPEKIYKNGVIHLIPVYLLKDVCLKTDLFVSAFALSEAPEVVQEIVSNKQFFNADLCYLTGQLLGWGPQHNWEHHHVIHTNLRNNYSMVECQPFHIFKKEQLSYEIIGMNLKSCKSIIERKYQNILQESEDAEIEKRGCSQNPEIKKEGTALIFSKDREMQLDATLRSFLLHCKGANKIEIKVLFSTSSPLHEEQYQTLRSEHTSVEFIKESNFKNDLLSIISSCDFVLFLVDDNIFVRDFSFIKIIERLGRNPDAVGFSLRLGKNTTYFYMLDKVQNLPDFTPINSHHLKFNWTISEYDFGYPLEVSSSVYRTQDILPFLEKLSFNNPNTLEEQMAEHKSFFNKSKPFLLCNEQSVTFCAPLNKVQTVLPDNRSGKQAEYSSENLAGLFEKGYRIDVAFYNGLVPKACHQEIELNFVQPMAASETSGKERPFVSVVIPCYNQAHFLPEAVESIIQQTYPNWEIIIVNDGSNDNTSEVAQKLISDFPDRKIYLIDKMNGGVADARNAGIRQARGSWILPLDADDMFASEFLETAVEIIRKNDNVNIIFCNLQQFGSASGEWIPDDYTPEAILRHNTFPYASLYKKELWDNTEGYYVGLPFQMEDRNFWVSCSKFGIVPTRIPHKMLLYRIHPSGSAYTKVLEHWDEMHAIVRTLHPDLYSFEQLLSDHELISRMNQDTFEKLESVIAKHAELYMPYFWRGLHYQCSNNGNLALADYQKSVELSEKKDWQPFLHLGLLNYKLGKNAEAIINFQKVILILSLSTHPTSKQIIQELNQLVNNIQPPHDLSVSNISQQSEIDLEKKKPRSSSMLKILFYYAGLHNSDKPFAGTNMATVTLASALVKTGNFSRVCVTGDFIAKQEVLDGVEFLPLPSHEQKTHFIEGYDAVVFATHLRYFADVPKPSGQIWVLHQHCWSVEPPEMIRINDFDIVLCLSDIHKYAVQSQGVPTTKLEVLPNMIDTTLFYPRAVDRNPHSIMFAGAVVPHKGIHILIDAFKIVERQIPDVELHIYGSASMWRDTGEYEIDMRKKAGQNIHFHGVVSNDSMPLVYSQHSVLCLPSMLESFSIVSVEAQACGCIPVAHNSGGIMATLLDGQTGFLYSPNTPQKLAQTILNAFDAIEADISFRDRARDFIRQNFDIRDQAEKFIDLVAENRLLETVAPPPYSFILSQPDIETSKKETVRDSILKSLTDVSVKRRVLSWISRLEQDYWLKGDIEKYENVQSAESAWFETIVVLNWFAHNFKPANYLEVGVRRGRSIVQVLGESPSTKAFGFDIWIEDYGSIPEQNIHTTNPGPEFVLSELKKLNISSEPTLFKGNSHETLPSFFADSNNPQYYDLINVDGDHTYYGAKLDLDVAFEHLAPDGALVFDDINHHAHPELRGLWNEYKEKYPEYIFVEDMHGTGTAVAFKPPFTKLAALEEAEQRDSALPIHFFTIVLNGEPFIRHHIEVLKNLPFEWHWHIIEGVADLKHDTAWSLQFGARISDELHRNGLSNDGTTEYLDDLKRQYPKNITIYRKKGGAFWDGKLEMVTAPLSKIKEECLLWQVDADELWTIEQICAGLFMFTYNIEKTAAYYFCHYFVGENLITTTIDTYGNNTSYEWLRTWRFTPGDSWLSHEPPRLCRQTEKGKWVSLEKIDPFTHRETESHGLVFQHYAYVTEAQLFFKERYFGYREATNQWQRLQQQKTFPIFLREYFVWVKDGAQVNTLESQGVTPVARRSSSGAWEFRQSAPRQVKPRHILWIRTDSIGDAILASSMLTHIRQKYSDYKITVVCQEHIGELYRECPYVDDVLTFKKEKFLSDEQYGNSILQKLQSFKPELALNSVFSREMVIDFLAINSAAKEKVAFYGNLCNSSFEFIKRANQFYSMLIPSKGKWKLELERHSDFLKGLGIDVPSLQPVIWLTEEDEKYADDFFKENNLDPKKSIAIFAGAQCEVRLYEHYGVALSSICQENGLTIIGLGAKHEYEFNEHNIKQSGARGINLTGKPTLRQTAAIIKRCRLAVGAETGLAHIACAVGTPNVILLGGGHFGRFMPYSTLTSVVCLPLECFGSNWNCKYERVHCVRDVLPEVYAEAIRQTLEKTSQKPRVFIQGRPLWKPGPYEPEWEWSDKFLDKNSVELITIDEVIGIPEEQHTFETTASLIQKHSLPDNSNVVDPVRQVQLKPAISVSAIVSTYNAEKFISGCLEDLTNQTLYKKGKLEIIVIDSGSQQNEKAIVYKFILKNNITYIRTEERETVYAAWNRGIKASVGKYVTNANTDDRHRKDALELMVEVLEKYPEFGLVYADSLITNVENETFEHNSATRQFIWPDYNLGTLLANTFFGPHPMWRREVHDRIGFFDPLKIISGDYDFWIRLAWRYGAVHLQETLGLFLETPGSISGVSNVQQSAFESKQLLRFYREQIPLVDIYPSLKDYINDPYAMAAVLLDFGNLCAMAQYSDFEIAEKMYKKAGDVQGLPAELASNLSAMIANNMSVLMFCSGDKERGREFLQKAGSLPDIQSNIDLMDQMERSGLPLSPIHFSMSRIEHPVINNARRTYGLRLDDDMQIVKTPEHQQVFWDIYGIHSGITVSAKEKLQAISGKPRMLKIVEKPVIAEIEDSKLITIQSEKKNRPKKKTKKDALNLLLAVHNLPANNRSGTELYTFNLAQELRQRGHSVSIVYPSFDSIQPPGPLTDVNDNGLSVTRLTLAPPNDIVHLFKNENAASFFGSHLKGLDADLVHFQHLIGFTATSLEICKHLGIPTVVTLHDEWILCEQLHYLRADGTFCFEGPESIEKCVNCFLERNPQVPSSQESVSGLMNIFSLRRQYLQNALSWIDSLIVPSKFLQHAIETHGFMHPKVYLSPLGLNQFDPIPWEPLNTGLRFTCLGNINFTKGLDILIQAFNMLPSKAVQLNIYGVIQDERYFNHVMAINRKGQSVKYHGTYTPEDLPAILAKTDIAVVPSRSESYSFVVRECLHAGVPVIASNVGGVPEIIEDGENGFLFKLGDYQDLARKLQFFALNPKKVAAFRKRIKPIRSITEDADQLEIIYR
ncbi:MAG: putative sugar O-methyltransferase, partial [Thermodesulfovibrionales bacterium]